jgi:hypothetical protein
MFRMSEHPPGLAALLHIYGEHWQIQQDGGNGVWTAIRRPTPTALHILVSYDLTGLAAKLEAAQAGER